MLISDWSSDVCSSDLPGARVMLTSGLPIYFRKRQFHTRLFHKEAYMNLGRASAILEHVLRGLALNRHPGWNFPGNFLQISFDEVELDSSTLSLATGPHTSASEGRSEEHTSELQSLMRISYAVFCLKKKTIQQNNPQ